MPETPIFLVSRGHFFCPTHKLYEKVFFWSPSPKKKSFLPMDMQYLHGGENFPGGVSTQERKNPTRPHSSEASRAQYAGRWRARRSPAAPAVRPAGRGRRQASFMNSGGRRALMRRLPIPPPPFFLYYCLYYNLLFYLILFICLFECGGGGGGKRCS